MSRPISRSECARCMAVRCLDDLRLLEAGQVGAMRRLEIAHGVLVKITRDARGFCVLCSLSPG